MSERPEDIVGHKTFDTGERGPDGFPAFRHEPLTRAEAEAIHEACEREEKQRAELMPDEKAALEVLFSAWLRLKDLGWREAMYCPKDGTHFKVIEPGSTGIFDCAYRGEWPDGSWDVYDRGDIWPSHPILFRLYPEDQAKYDEAMETHRRRYQSLTSALETKA